MDSKTAGLEFSAPVRPTIAAMAGTEHEATRFEGRDTGAER